MRFAFVLMLLCGPGVSSRADAPPEVPSLRTVYSNNRRFFAQTNPRTKTTTVYQAALHGVKPKRLWRMKGWFRALYLADDGAHLVAGYDGANLLRLDDARPQTVMLRFLNKGRLLRQVTLGELGLNPQNLRRTVSHFAWREVEGFDKTGRYYVDTIDGRRLQFDVRTGRITRVSRIKSAA